MMYDRIAPDEPTREPATINMLFSSVKPIPAAAQPENELRSDTTTGISPPPTGAIHTSQMQVQVLSLPRKQSCCQL